MDFLTFRFFFESSLVKNLRLDTALGEERGLLVGESGAFLGESGVFLGECGNLRADLLGDLVGDRGAGSSFCCRGRDFLDLWDFPDLSDECERPDRPDLPDLPEAAE